jgi:hypothetical protein
MNRAGERLTSLECEIIVRGIPERSYFQGSQFDLGNVGLKKGAPSTVVEALADLFRAPRSESAPA